MTMSDPIADMLTRIRNANTAKHDTVDIPYSKIKFSIAQILLHEGYVKSIDLVDNGNFKDIRVALKYGADKNDKIDKVRGMDIIFTTTAHTDEEARELLRLFNMPFARD